MDISAIHAAARLAASRIPALEASLALLASATDACSTIEFYADPRPAPGQIAFAPPLAVGDLTAQAGAVSGATFQLILDGPIEAQVSGADPTTGSHTTWARILTPTGSWWGDLSVSTLAAGTGEIQMEQTLLLNGAFVRAVGGFGG